MELTSSEVNFTGEYKQRLWCIMHSMGMESRYKSGARSIGIRWEYMHERTALWGGVLLRFGAQILKERFTDRIEL